MKDQFVVTTNQGFKQILCRSFDTHEDAYSCFCDLMFTLEKHLTIRMELQRNKKV